MVGGQADATVAYAEADTLAVAPGQQRRRRSPAGMASIASTALRIRLPITCCTCTRSACTCGRSGSSSRATATPCRFSSLRDAPAFPPPPGSGRRRVVPVPRPASDRGCGRSRHRRGARRRDAGYGLPGLVHVRRVLRQPALAGFGAAGDCGQWLVDFMGDGGGELARWTRVPPQQAACAALRPWPLPCSERDRW